MKNLDSHDPIFGNGIAAQFDPIFGNGIAAQFEAFAN